MIKISNQIFSVIKEGSIKYIELEMDERKRVLEQIRLKYLKEKKEGSWMWENLNDPTVIHDKDAWRYLKHFIGNDDCIILFDQKDDETMFSFSNGKDLDYILSQTFGFEFYITNKDLEYLFCFNHHDILYGCGTAKNWMRLLLNEK